MLLVVTKMQVAYLFDYTKQPHNTNTFYRKIV